MKNALIISIIFLLIIAGLAAFINLFAKESVDTIRVSNIVEKENNIKIQSASFKSYTMIPSKYTCDGKNVNPPLSISGVPEGTKSLVLIMDDPDATSGTWTHWTVWNINPKKTQIPENSIPEGGVEGVTSFKKTGYLGPCPPSGQHRYFFQLYALDTILNIPTSSSKQNIEKAMEGHINASSELVGFYSHK